MEQPQNSNNMADSNFEFKPYKQPKQKLNGILIFAGIIFAICVIYFSYEKYISNENKDLVIQNIETFKDSVNQSPDYSDNKNTVKNINIDQVINSWKKEVYYNGTVSLNSPPGEKELTIDDLDSVISSLEYHKVTNDLNKDGKLDYFVYYNNPTYGNWVDSDLGLVIYSDQGQYLTNPNITNDIKNKIEKELIYKFNIFLDDYLYIFYDDMSKTITGEWAIKHGRSGSFAYNLIYQTVVCNLYTESNQ